jgi:hypothetical protein
MRDLATPWPFGLGQTDFDIDALQALPSFPITVMAGTADVESTGRFFPKGPRSTRQGANRYERAQFPCLRGRFINAMLLTQRPEAATDECRSHQNGAV